MRGKRGAIELSIGTIVIIVLAMSMLILGLVLVKNIFTGATSIADMTNDQLRDQVSKLFSGDKKLVVYPDARHIKLKQGETEGFGIGIKNLLPGTTESTIFSYEVVISDPNLRRNCGGISENEALAWIVTGQAEDRIPIASGDFASSKVLLNVPVGSPLCTLRYRVNVRANNADYKSELMDITIEAA
jgi:hypothetical protein